LNYSGRGEIALEYLSDGLFLNERELDAEADHDT
jgi:hypothetical protein